MGKALHLTLVVAAAALLGIDAAEGHEASGSGSRDGAHRHGPASQVDVAADTALRGANDPDQGQRRERARVTHQHGSAHREYEGGKAHDGGHQHGIENENLFGFTLGSDTEEAGAAGAALENILRVGKRAGSYHGLAQKLEYSFGVTNA
jgi:hypothetical protein